MTSELKPEVERVSPEVQRASSTTKSKTNPNTRYSTIVAIYIELIGRFRKQGRPTDNLARRLLEITGNDY